MADQSKGQASSTRLRNTVDESAEELVRAITRQFRLSCQMSAIDINNMAAMNKSVEAFHAALQERVEILLSSAQSAQSHANASHPLAEDMKALVQKARHLEALVDRLEEYTAKQEAALTRHNK